MSDHPPTSSLFHRLREWFGLAPGSVREDIEEALEEIDLGGDFSPKERTILKNVLALHDVRVANVMTPRADIVALSLEATLTDTLNAFRTAGHSRLPVYHETLDDPRGMIHIRDFLDFLAQNSIFSLSEASVRLADTPLVRPLLFAPLSMPALDLLARMQTARIHIALVIDEYGGTDGLVSMEDIVETIVGNIEDEHDETEEAQIAKGTDGSINVEARVPLEEIAQALNLDFTDLKEAEDVDTIGGLITTLAGRLPARGELIAGPHGLEFEILDADPRRLKRIRIHSPFVLDSKTKETLILSKDIP